MNTQKEKSINDLVLIDDWLFGNFFSQPEYFKIMIEILLNRKVKEVKTSETDSDENVDTQKSNNKTNLFSNQPDNNSNATLEAQKTAISNWGFKFVRFDIIFEDSDEIINVEMQNAKQSQDLLPKRAAYYTTKINEEALKKGEDYTEKRNTYVIFLCDFDPFNNGDYKYTAKYMCCGEPSEKRVDYDTGDQHLFFNLKSKQAPKDYATFFWLLKNTNKSQEELPESIRNDNRLQRIYEGVRIMKQSSLSKEYYDEYLRDVKDIKAEGEAKGRAKTLVENIKSVMESFGISLEEALDALKIPQSEYETYKKLIG